MYGVDYEMDPRLEAFLGVSEFRFRFYITLYRLDHSQDNISSSTWGVSAILCDLNYEKLFDFIGSTGIFIHQVPRRSDITPQ